MISEDQEKVNILAEYKDKEVYISVKNTDGESIYYC